MGAKSILTTGAAGGGFLATGLALSSILASSVQAIHSAKEFGEAAHYYTDLKTSILQWLGFTSEIGPVSSISIDLFVIWISTFLAVNFMIYRADEVFVWGHIRHNRCYSIGRRFLSQSRCIFPKFIGAFIAAPVICILALITSLKTGRTSMTMANITVDPAEISKFVLVCVAVPLLLVLVLGWIASISTASLSP